MRLKQGIGRVEIKSKGITLTVNSTSEEISRALKHAPQISEFITDLKTGKNDGKEKTKQ